jgi:23S rRNA (uracil1939-C5)-methyltransferase
MPIMTITDLSWGGEGIGRIEGQVVFVPYALPGEVIEIRIMERRKNFSRGKLIKVLEPSPDRVEPPCAYFTACGGCQLQHLSEARQPLEKERLFRQALLHGLKPSALSFLPILSSPLKLGYRDRLQLKILWKEGRPIFGFFGPKSRELIPIEHCLLANKSLNRVLPLIKEGLASLPQKISADSLEIQLFEEPLAGGLLFTSINLPEKSRRRGLTRALAGLPGLQYILFQDSGKRRLVGDLPFSAEQHSPVFLLPAVESGLPRDIRMACFPQVFSQVNMGANRLLLATLLKRSIWGSGEALWDLYSGMGNFSIPFSFKVREVIGIEAFPAAVVNARWNRSLNQVSNCRFILGQAGEELARLKKERSGVSLLILDPPRSGAKEVIPELDSCQPEGILYISCDPMTLVRDLKGLTERGWQIIWSQGLDFFPQTYHLESITFLRR